MGQVTKYSFSELLTNKATPKLEECEQTMLKMMKAISSQSFRQSSELRLSVGDQV